MTTMDDARLLLQRGVSIREEPFTLSAGGQSRIYADLRWPVLDKPGAIGITFTEFIRKNIVDAKGVAGIGGVPLMGPVLAALVAERMYLPAFAVRKEAKGHGTGKRVEGRIPEGSVILVEDVITTGTTLSSAIDALSDECEVEVDAVVALCNRGGITMINGVPVYQMFTLHEIANGHPDYETGVT